jgi:SnoaL-like protein
MRNYLLLVLTLMFGLSPASPQQNAPVTKVAGKSAIKETPSEKTMRDLFDRWELVWHEGQYDLVAECVQPKYIRHDEAGDRTVTREAYAAEIAKVRQERPHLRFVAYDHTFEGNRAWVRFTMKWDDSKTGETRTRAGMQVYRIEAGKFAETWLMLQPLASAWTDTAAQEHWTSPPPIK